MLPFRSPHLKSSPLIQQKETWCHLPSLSSVPYYFLAETFLLTQKAQRKAGNVILPFSQLSTSSSIYKISALFSACSQLGK